MNNKPSKYNKVSLWTGRILSALCVLFLLVDALMKIARASASVRGTANLGFSDGTVQPMGFWLLAFTVLYCIPRTSVLGALLLTAHLGGAVAIFVQQIQGTLHFLFPLLFCVLVWLGLWLRDEKLRALILNRNQVSEI